MNKKNYVLIIIIIFLLSGCKSTYLVSRYEVGCDEIQKELVDNYSEGDTEIVKNNEGNTAKVKYNKGNICKENNRYVITRKNIKITHLDGRIFQDEKVTAPIYV